MITDSLFKTEGAARYLGLGKSTMAKFRITGGGPRFIKMGAAVRYRRADLDAWAAERSRRSTSEAARA